MNAYQLIKEKNRIKREELKSRGLIIEESVNEEELKSSEDDNDLDEEMDDSPEDDDPVLQTQIISFFINNPFPSKELIDQFSVSIGSSPEEVWRQICILFTHLVEIYDEDLQDETEWKPEPEFNPEEPTESIPELEIEFKED